MELFGYANRLSVAGGDRISFKVTCDADRYDATIVRLLHGDTNPAGPGFKEVAVDAFAPRTLAGRQQSVHPGAFVQVDGFVPPAGGRGFTLAAFVLPTRVEGSDRGIISCWDPAKDSGVTLLLDERGALGLRVRENGLESRVDTGAPLALGRWYFVAAAVDEQSGAVHLFHQGVAGAAPDGCFVRRELDATLVATDTLLLGAGGLASADSGRAAPSECFNGKLERPLVLAGHADVHELRRLADAEPGAPPAGDVHALWDFDPTGSGMLFPDRGPHGFHGRAVNLPVLGVTGRAWTQREHDYRVVPDQYRAIELHEDALEDAGWLTDFEWEIPPDLPSGVYAAKLTSGEMEDHVPFWVRAPIGAPTADIALLFPTMTYLAYGNERLRGKHEVTGDGRATELDPNDQALDRHPEYGMSTYDSHAGGAGCCYSSRLRPLLNMRPKYRMWLTDGPVHFGQDLSMVDWLLDRGFDHDVITDEDVHHHGPELLAPYRVLVTGSHPEYWTWPMRDALCSYLDGGGRLMYLGGNGFYWVTSVDPERPHVIEIRRGYSGTRSWESRPGELLHASTGALGGLWRHVGESPAALVGVSAASQGFEHPAVGYERTQASFDERAAFIFEGVGDDETIGDFGLAMGGGAAGHETDRADPAQGTPAHALVVATSQQLNKSYQLMVEQVPMISPGLDGETNHDVRADVVFFETPAGGAVFSVGSITWTSALSHRGYANNVSRITENVLRRFLRDLPFEYPARRRHVDCAT